VKKSRITFEVERERVEVIVGLLINEVTDFQVTEVHMEAPIKNGRGSKSTRWAMAPARAILEHVKKSPAGTEFFYKDLGKVLSGCGLKETSISPILSALVEAGKMKKTKRGYYST
jgi:hypothetical protein